MKKMQRDAQRKMKTEFQGHRGGHKKSGVSGKTAMRALGR